MTETPEYGVDDAVVLLLGSDPGKAERRGEIRGITRLEKLVFLLEQGEATRSAMTESADFKAYNYGPFSQKVYQALEMLRSAGLITDTAEATASNEDQYEVELAVGADAAPAPYSTRDFRLTELGRQYYAALKEELPSESVREAEIVRQRFAGWSLRQLIRYVYKRNEDFTQNSLIRDEILGN